MAWRTVPFRTFLAYGERMRVQRIERRNADARAHWREQIAEEKRKGR